VFQDLMTQYEIFLQARAAIIAEAGGRP
jgi:hypothetical protein